MRNKYVDLIKSFCSKNVLFLIAFAMLFITSNVWSQNEFYFHTGLSIPTGDFADESDDESSSGAGVGLYLSMKYMYNFPNSSMSYFICGDFNYNGLKKSVKEDVDEALDDLGVYATDVKYEKYINFPILTGLNVSFSGGENITIFYEGGVGIDYFKITDFSALASQNVEITYGSSIALAYRIGAGIKLNNKFVINLNYSGLGKHSFKPKIKIGYQTLTERIKPSVDIISLSLGVRL